MDILGISCFYHDSAACMIRNGQIFAAAQEERFTRKKHDPRFPRNAIQYCLAEAGLAVPHVDHRSAEMEGQAVDQMVLVAVEVAGENGDDSAFLHLVGPAFHERFGPTPEETVDVV